MRKLLATAGRAIAFAQSIMRDLETANTIDVRVHGASLVRIVEFLAAADYLVVTAESHRGLGPECPSVPRPEPKRMRYSLKEA